MANRKAAEDFIIEYVCKIMGEGKDGPNAQLYINYFKSINDKEFDQYIKDLETEMKHLVIIAPNLAKTKISTERNLAIAKELGHSFFQRIWIEGQGDKPTYLTPIPYMVVDLPIRRQAQLLVKKISIPEDNKSVDEFTGQATGKSKGAGISYPEVQVMAAMNLNNSLLEMIKFRGGDVKGFNAMNDSISRTGGVNLDAIKHVASGVESTRLLKTYLTTIHLKSTIEI